MKKKRYTCIWGAFILVMLSLFSCHKPQGDDATFIGHWGCEKYISCRTDSAGNEQWDTLYYEIGPGHGYEVWFFENGKGKLTLNDSPAFIKTFNFDYQYDSDRSVVMIQGQALLFYLYGSQYLDQNYAEISIDQVSDTTLQASWRNAISESVPFDEWFFMKRIE